MSTYVNVLIILLLIKYALNHWPGLSREKNQLAFLVIASILLALFTGFRDEWTGPDTDGYIRAFFSYKRVDSVMQVFNRKVKNDEYGYALWNWIISRFTDNVNVFFTLTSSFFAYSLARFIYKNSHNQFFSMILYYTVGMFGFQMTGMRQAMAMAVLLFSFEYIKERKLIKFIIVCFVASWFHKSALTFLVAYPFAYMKINFKNFTIIFSLFLFSLFYGAKLSQIMGNLIGYEREFDAGIRGDIGGETVIGMLLIAIILSYMFSMRLSEQSKYNAVYFNLTVYTLVIYILRYSIHALERVSHYYQYAFIILLPNAIEAIPDKKTKKVVYTCAVVLACALFFYRYQLKGTSYYGFFVS